MKKLFFTFATALFVSLTAQAKSVSQPIQNYDFEINPATPAIVTENAENPFIKIKIKLDFGRKSKGCTGFGVCSLTLETEIDFPISVEVTKNEMTLEMTEAGQQSVARYFGGNKIILEEDFVLSPEFDKQFGLPENTIWPAGTYNVVKTSAGTYQAKVQLK